MNTTFLPKTKLGKWATFLLFISFIVIVIGNFDSILYDDVAAFCLESIIIGSVFFAFIRTIGVIIAITSAILAVNAVVKAQERSILVYFNILIGLIIASFIVIDLVNLLNII